MCAVQADVHVYARACGVCACARGVAGVHVYVHACVCAAFMRVRVCMRVCVGG